MRKCIKLIQDNIPMIINWSSHLNNYHQTIHTPSIISNSMYSEELDCNLFALLHNMLLHMLKFNNPKYKRILNIVIYYKSSIQLVVRILPIDYIYLNLNSNNINHCQHMYNRFHPKSSHNSHHCGLYNQFQKPSNN